MSVGLLREGFRAGAFARESNVRSNASVEGGVVLESLFFGSFASVIPRRGARAPFERAASSFADDSFFPRRELFRVSLGRSFGRSFGRPPGFLLSGAGLRAAAAAATSASAASAAAAATAASVAPAVGIAAGLVLGKPLGIFGFTWLADKLGIAALPSGMNLSHLGVVGMLGGIGFTMCLLLTEVALPSAMQTIPKLAVLASSALAAAIAAAMMARMPPAEEA